MALTITSRQTGGIEILTLSGRLTLGDPTADLRDTARKALDRGSDILVDLSGVDYMDSAGLGELVGVHAAGSNRSRRVKLLRPMQRVTQLLHLTKLYTTFEIFESETEAITSFERSVAETA
ncbi:MAG: STAS domain-containing protein [Acidobacteria bacterium]|nr:STAS domain-containing protein [Acidobacteriota bacterium]